jgi:hypothetical protein
MVERASVAAGLVTLGPFEGQWREMAHPHTYGTICALRSGAGQRGLVHCNGIPAFLPYSESHSHISNESSEIPTASAATIHAFWVF